MKYALAFEIVYDKVAWCFILDMLQSLGMESDLVGNLFLKALFYLSINHDRSNEIGIFKSIRKGFSLVPTFHMVANESISYLIHNKMAIGLIKGMLIPNLNNRKKTN